MTMSKRTSAENPLGMFPAYRELADFARELNACDTSGKYRDPSSPDFRHLDRYRTDCLCPSCKHYRAIRVSR